VVGEAALFRLPLGFLPLGELGIVVDAHEPDVTPLSLDPPLKYSRAVETDSESL